MPKKLQNINYPKNTRFCCTRCTLCCGDAPKKVRHIVMLEDEAERISEKVLEPVVHFAIKIEGRSPYVYEMRKNEIGKCVFLNKDTCTIYLSRPLVCRFYPFEMRSEEKHEHFFSFTDECPGIGKGKRMTRRHFMELLRQAKDQLG